MYISQNSVTTSRVSEDRLRVEDVPVDVEDKEQMDVVNKVKELLNAKIKEVNEDVTTDASTTLRDEEETTTLAADLLRDAASVTTTSTTTTTTTTTTVYTTVYVPPPPPPQDEPQQPAAPANPGFFARIGEFFGGLSNFGFRPIVLGRK